MEDKRLASIMRAIDLLMIERARSAFAFKGLDNQGLILRHVSDSLVSKTMIRG